MTVASTTNRKEYAGNSVTTAFATSPVVFYDASDLAVYLVDAAGVATLKTITTHYTVSGGNGTTGTVTMLVAPATGENLVIVRSLPLVQAVDFVNNDASDADVAETALDKLTMMVQQVSAKTDRSFGLADSDTSGASTTLPTPEANTLLGWDGVGTALQNYSASSLSTALTTAYTLTLLDDPNAATARATLGISAANVPNTPAGNIAATDVQAALNELDTEKASTASLSNGSNPKVPVRQTILYGALDSSGYASHLSAGAGLNFNVAATATPLVITYANGFGASGDVDTVTVVSADASNQGSLAASNLNYINTTRVSDTAVTWGSTLAPPQYGYAYDRTKQSLLRFAGTDGSTTILDDYGNTWAAVGNAQIDTAVQIDGLNTLLLDGTGDYVESTNFTTLGSGAWTLECKVRWNTLPAGSDQVFFCANNAGNFGVTLGLNDTAGTKKLTLSLSSTGSSLDLASAVLGTSTTWATGTTYHIAISFDQVNGYRVFKDGVSEAALANGSLSRICAITKIRLGANNAGGSALNGAMAGFRFLPYCAYPNAATFTAPTISTFTVNSTASSDFFSIPAMTMYGVTAASASAGTNPTLTAKNVVYHGEAVTGGATVSSIVNYAYKGQYVSADTTIPAVGTRTAFSGNLGVIPQVPATAFMRNITAEAGYTPGMIAPVFTQSAAGYLVPMVVNLEDRNTLSATVGGTNPIAGTNRTTGVGVTLSTGNWKMFITANRGW